MWMAVYVGIQNAFSSCIPSSLYVLHPSMNFLLLVERPHSLWCRHRKADTERGLHQRDTSSKRVSVALNFRYFIFNEAISEGYSFGDLHLSFKLKWVDMSVQFRMEPGQMVQETYTLEEEPQQAPPFVSLETNDDGTTRRTETTVNWEPNGNI